LVDFLDRQFSLQIHLVIFKLEQKYHMNVNTSNVTKDYPY
jgi:hypothetical protein